MRSKPRRPTILAGFYVLSQFLLFAAAPAAAQTSESSALALRPGDALRLEVKDEPKLNGQFIIGEDGKVLLPLVGLLPIAGQPFTTVAEIVRVAFAHELADPVIRVTPLLRVPVLGEVRQPGLFFVDPTQSVADVIATAGGLSANANRKRITLVRAGQAVQTRLDPASRIPDIALRSGDQLVVGRRSWLSDNSGTFVGAAATVAAAAITSWIVH